MKHSVDVIDNTYHCLDNSETTVVGSLFMLIYKKNV